MVNIIKNRQEMRRMNIANVCGSIKKKLDTGKTIHFNDIVIATMSNLIVSRRIAQEYVEVALFQIGIDKEKMYLKGYSKKEQYGKNYLEY